MSTCAAGSKGLGGQSAAISPRRAATVGCWPRSSACARRATAISRLPGQQRRLPVRELSSGRLGVVRRAGASWGVPAQPQPCPLAPQLGHPQETTWKCSAVALPDGGAQDGTRAALRKRTGPRLGYLSSALWPATGGPQRCPIYALGHVDMLLTLRSGKVGSCGSSLEHADMKYHIS